MLACKFRFESAVFFALFAFSLARADDSSLTNNIKWGETVNGLQMGVEQDKSASYIHCWVRNATTNNLTCNLWNLGEWQNVGIEIEFAGEPKALKFSDLYASDGVNWLAIKNGGPIKEDIKHLLPKEVSHYSEFFAMAEMRFGPVIAITNVD